MNIAIVLSSLSGSDVGYKSLKFVNSLVNNNSVSPSIFYKDIGLTPIKPLCLSMNIYSISSFNGIAIATDFSTATILRNNNSKCKKLLYLSNIEWLESIYYYEAATSLIEDFEILIRDPEMHDVVLNYCNKKPVVLEDFTWEGLEKCLKIKKII